MKDSDSILTVTLGDRSYPIHIGRNETTGLTHTLERIRDQKRSCAVITDSTVELVQSAFINDLFHDIPRIAIPAGESSKNLSQLEQVLEFLAEHRLNRQSLIFAVGGGVVGDLAGFAAACYMRGIDFIQVPTTLLAMVDSSVGGKTGVNLASGKNLVGAFLQPQAVFIDTLRLDTLDKREFAAGMAEIIKAGLLADRELFEMLEQKPVTSSNDPNLVQIIRRACSIKAQIVSADERESAASGGRALLNLGHTFGHAIENATGYQGVLHGEGVAIGTVMAADLSAMMGLISPGDSQRIAAVFAANGLPSRLPTAIPAAKLLDAMGRDKKNRDGLLRFVVLSSIGEAITHDNVPVDLVMKALSNGGAT